MADPTAAQSLVEFDSSHLSQPHDDHLDLLPSSPPSYPSTNPTSRDIKGKGRAPSPESDDMDWEERGRGQHIYSHPHSRQDLELEELEDSLGPQRAGGLGEEEKKRLSRVWWRNAAVNVAFIGAWYCFSTLLSVYNKWMFSKEHYNFPYPLFVTSIHMLVQFALSFLTLTLFPSLKSPNRPNVEQYGKSVVPCGMATGLDIGLSNLSLRSITLSFYTMCKSSSLAFVLLFAFLFRLETPSFKLLFIILIITSGVILMVSTETQFDLVGMFEVLSASALGGLRWSLTQILLEDKGKMGMGNPISTLFWLAPVMGVTLGSVSMIKDGWGNVFGNEDFFGDFWKTLETMTVIFAPGVIAFAMNVTEFGLIQRTSVVTLSVAGIFKEVAVIFLSMFIFHDQLTPINVSGLCVTIFGIALYNYFKYQQFTRGEITAHGGKKVDDEEALEGERGIPIVEDSQEEGAPMLPILKRSNDFSAPLHSLGNSSDSESEHTSSPKSSRGKSRGRSSSISQFEQEDIARHSLKRFSKDSKKREQEMGRIEGLEDKLSGGKGEREEEDWDLLGDGK